MRVVLLSALVILTALAGCFGGDDPGDGDPTGTPTGTQTTTTGNGNASAGNAAPEVFLTASNTTLVKGDSVNITLDATDADNDTLSWDLDLNGDGTFDETGFGDLPRSFSGTFVDAGNYTLLAQVDDGTVLVNATLLIVVTEPAPIESPYEPIEFSGTVLAADPLYLEEQSCGADLFVSFFGFLEDFAAGQTGTPRPHNYFPVPSETWGWTYAFDVAGVAADFWNRDAAGALGSGTAGTVPQQATWVFVCGSEPTTVDQDFVLTLTPPSA